MPKNKEHESVCKHDELRMAYELGFFEGRLGVIEDRIELERRNPIAYRHLRAAAKAFAEKNWHSIFKEFFQQVRRSKQDMAA